MCLVNSVLGHHGCRPRIPPLEVYLVAADEQQGKDRRGDGDEHGSLVRIPGDGLVDEADLDSAAGAAAMKMLAFPEVFNNPGNSLSEVPRPSRTDDTQLPASTSSSGEMPSPPSASWPRPFRFCAPSSVEV